MFNHAGRGVESCVRASERASQEERKTGIVGRVSEKERERERESARCRKNGKPAFVEREKERFEGWLDEGGWGDRRWLGTERERRGERGDGSETGESWTGKKQKCIAARWPSTERLSRLRASIGENGDTESAAYGICVPA